MMPIQFGQIIWGCPVLGLNTRTIVDITATNFGQIIITICEEYGIGILGFLKDSQI